MTDTNTLPSLDDIRAMLAKLSASGVDVSKLAKESTVDKPTLQSVTFDAIVAACVAGPVLTDNVTKAVTAKAREVGLLEDSEEAKAANVQTLIRYARAYDDAMVRAGYEWSKKAVEAAPEGEPAPEGAEAPAEGATTEPPADTSKDVVTGNYRQNRKAA